METNKRAIIFDFDGTIADTEQCGMKVLSRIAALKKVPIPSREFIRNHNTREILKQMKIRWWELPKISSLSRTWAIEEEPTVKLFPWTSRILQISKQHGNIWIVSSSDPARIHTALLNGGIDLKIENIIGNVGFLGKSSAIKKLLKREKLESTQVIYVGDETRDIEASKKAGIFSCAVGWGFQSAQILLSMLPDLFIPQPDIFEAMVSDFFKKNSDS